jgi:tetratricopeptide (TPR) repeat protein
MSDVDIPDRLTRYGGEATIERVALLRGDLATLRPMTFPASDKKTDARHPWFVKNHGDVCCELDALDANVLRQRVENAIVTHLDVAAWNLARAGQLTGLAVDAAHMVAITHSGTSEGIAWNRLGLSIARGALDPKAVALIPAMLNNAAWDLHALGRYAEALTYFEEAEAEWLARGKPKQIQIAKWSVARCLRSLGRHREALAIQQALAAEHKAAGTTDPYVDEEIAANLAALTK